ncbi:UDP-galactose-lipid carrier transferase [bacterium]|nr:UDP-galactose-lipid carrier transferase [bacterium]
MPQPLEVLPSRPPRLADLDMQSRLTRGEYRAQISALQLKMVELQRRIVRRGMRVLIIVEGVDAAGKGGAIKRLTQHLDPRWLRVHSLSRPSASDAQYLYLRRYIIRLPKAGRITIFDDYSWYGRLLVEHIEKAVTDEEYERARREIVELERWLTDSGFVLIKLWLQVSPDEQVERFHKRASDPLRAWKLTPDDWRTNEMYGSYMKHADAMFKATHTPNAPWLLIPGDDKLYARVAVLQAVEQAVRSHRS